MSEGGVVLLPLFPVVHDSFPSGAMPQDDREQDQKDDPQVCNVHSEAGEKSEGTGDASKGCSARLFSCISLRRLPGR